MPMSLAELSLRTSYHKGRDDIAREFYLPCMARAVSYDRAVGFFRSTVFAVAWPALRDFVARNAKMRLLCSHVLSEDDVTALEEGYSARVDLALNNHFVEEVRKLISDPVLRNPARALAALVANNTISLKVAVLREADRVRRAGRIFHDKLGVFRDSDGHTVVFKGSMNETWTGLAADGNLESIDVATSWSGDRDTERVRVETDYFEDLWYDKYDGLYVREFPAVAKEELRQAASAIWDAELETALMAGVHRSSITTDPQGRTLLEHQKDGIASWNANGRRGILQFATGSGKTFTAIQIIRDGLLRLHEVVIVVVPDRVLFTQWLKELEITTKDLDAKILRAGAGNSNWRNMLRPWTAPGQHRRIVLVTIQTASSQDFLSRLSRGSSLLLVVDEVHRAGSQKHGTILNDAVFRGARLGLSATPERAGDPGGTTAILNFFGGILPPTYSLSDAIAAGVLCKYIYRPHIARLNAVEQEEWDRLSARIRRLAVRSDSPDGNFRQALKMLIFKRARIVKRAAAKVALAVEVLREFYQQGQRWLIYCDDRSQLDSVRDALAAIDIRTTQYHSAMEGSREETLRWLSDWGGIVVAIKCLDEGVDVRSISHALILASSKNPREFIQRRGRVLRTAPGKSVAYIHDAIVLPAFLPNDGPDQITAGELARALSFAAGAYNPACAADLKSIAIDLGIDEDMAQLFGLETEEDEDEDEDQ